MRRRPRRKVLRTISNTRYTPPSTPLTVRLRNNNLKPQFIIILIARDRGQRPQNVIHDQTSIQYVLRGDGKLIAPEGVAGRDALVAPRDAATPGARDPPAIVGAGPVLACHVVGQGFEVVDAFHDPVGGGALPFASYRDVLFVILIDEGESCQFFFFFFFFCWRG